MIDKKMNIQAISPKDLLTYLCLRRCKNSVTGESSVTISEINRQTGASPVTIINSLERLKSTGHIEGIKRGRSNVYRLLSNISASSFAFLDEDIPYAKKIKAAVEVALVEDTQETNSLPKDKLYDYVVELEKDIILLKKHNKILVDELERVRKCISVITGVEYAPLVLPT